jgi:glutamyl-tRNA(Gln) amidotransferase subunit D
LYSQEIESLLKSKKIKIGDRIRILKKDATHEGLLMPRIELGDSSCLVIKLDSGYNIGIKFEKGLAVKLLKRGKPIRFRPAKALAKKDPEKPTVAILGCGGTIASRIEYTTGAVFPAFSPADLLLSFPEIKDVANIKSRKLFDLFSEDMTAEHWKIVAREVAKEIKSKADGIVLMHGTDTLHYTATALSFMLQDLPVPVVLVGAQRSSDRGSSDNAVNLVCSTVAATSDIAEVTVCMHGSSSDDFCFVHQGTKVRKLHTSARNAFQSVNVLPYAKINYPSKVVEYLRNDYRKRDNRTVKVDEKINENVGLVYIYPGIKPENVENIARMYDGVVVVATGLGHVPTNPSNDKLARSLVPVLKNLISSGIPVVIAPQTIHGRLNLKVYSAGRILNEIGVIGHDCDWTPETALVKLMFVLGHTKDPNKIKEMMLTNIAGEIGKRTEVESLG